MSTALASGDVAQVEDYLVANSHLPGPRLNLHLIDEFASAVPTSEHLQPKLPTWLDDDSPGDDPRVILPCAAAVAYGELAATSPDSLEETDDRLYRAASDSRWRVREAVTLGLQRMLKADFEGTIAILLGWAEDDDPLVVRAAAAGVAEPPLLKRHTRARRALEVQRRAVDRLHRTPSAERRTESTRTLRQALGFTISVAVAASGDFKLLKDMAATNDPDLIWVVQQNLKKARLHPLPDDLKDDVT